jgi:hypothetical protein
VELPIYGDLVLKIKGFLEHVNTSHIHDLAKFVSGLVFSGHLWFSQFMLIWYANIPEEITYFITRIELYNLPFFWWCYEFPFQY